MMGAPSVCSNHSGSRKRSRAPFFAFFVVLSVAVLFLAGCYEVEKEVITAAEAVSIHGVEGTYNTSDGTTTISAVPHSRDYRFRSISKKGRASAGYLRAIPLRGNIYLVQIKYDDEPIYCLVFYRFTVDSRGGKKYTQLEADVSDERLIQVASSHGAKLFADELGLYLEGDRKKMLSFLLAHKAFRFTE